MIFIRFVNAVSEKVEQGLGSLWNWRYRWVDMFGILFANGKAY